MSVIIFYFGWPDGAVYSNLLASMICFIIALGVAHHLYDLRKIHAAVNKRTQGPKGDAEGVREKEG
jgi:hypothetical protein